MKFLYFNLMLFLTSALTIRADSSSTLLLRGVIRPDITVYFDHVKGPRVYSNSYFKKTFKVYKYEEKYKTEIKKKNKYKQLEISMN